MNKSSKNNQRSVFITGGSRGIGASCVRKFAGEGWNVAFTYNENKALADELVSELIAELPNLTDELPDWQEAELADVESAREQSASESKAKSRIFSSQLDVTDFDRIGHIYNEGLKYLGIDSFDAVIVNAGVSKSGTVDAMSLEDIDYVIDANLKGAIHTAIAAYPSLVSAKSGSMVFISSMLGGSMGASCETVYAATKAGIEGFGRSLAAELGPSNIRVNMIAPGVIDTDMNKVFSEEELKDLSDATPLGRLGSPNEVAEAVYFLADCEKSSFITGQVLMVDGGFTI